MNPAPLYEEDLPDRCALTQAISAGAPEVLEPTTGQAPRPGPHQLLVRATAIGVNFIETYQRSGVYPVDYPFTPGSEASGVVVATGGAVESFAIDDRITTCEAASGTYASYFLVDAEKAVAVPDTISDHDAAALPLQGITAHYLMNSAYKVSPGETVLTHAGAGGVGLLLTQLLKAKGARVITTTSTPAKARLAEEAGADEVLSYDNFAQGVQNITDGEGVSVVFDGVGKSTFEGSLRSLSPRGTLVLFGAASGPVPPFDLQELNSRGGLFITRPSLGWYMRNREERAWRYGDLFSTMEKSALQLRIGATYALADAAQAHRDLESRSTTGKLLLLP